MPRLRHVVHLIGGTIAVAGIVTAFWVRDLWWPYHVASKHNEVGDSSARRSPAVVRVVLTDQAIANLGLTARTLRPESYWRTILVPGSIVDRPGHSDRVVVAPITSVVTAIGHLPGDTVLPGETLFTLRPLSESFHQSQTELFKATQDIKLTQSLRKRLESSGGAVPEARLLELDTQITRLELTVRANRQDLQARGLRPDQIDAVAAGTFVTEIRVPVPMQNRSSPMATGDPSDGSATYEIHELRVDLGQQVQAGQTLCLLANHRMLAVEGRAFPDETPLLERAVNEGWPVEVDFQEATDSGWPAGAVLLPITHLANAIDPASRTFAFLMPLDNQSRTVVRDGRTLQLWRYRPGQKVRLRVRIERLDGVFVVPSGAVVHDGAETFVFTQNVNTFERRPVRLIVAEHDRAVIANDGSLPTGLYVVQSSAAQLNRMAKSRSTDIPAGYHVHADGSLHKNDDEHK